MHVIVALHVVPHTVLVEGGNKSILSEPVLGRVVAEQDIDVVLTDHALVAKHEGVATRRLAGQRGVNPGQLLIDRQFRLGAFLCIRRRELVESTKRALL